MYLFITCADDDDGIPDQIDTDANGDGRLDRKVDSDGDGIPDLFDDDADGDGRFDKVFCCCVFFAFCLLIVNVLCFVCS